MAGRYLHTFEKEVDCNSIRKTHPLLQQASVQIFTDDLCLMVSYYFLSVDIPLHSTFFSHYVVLKFSFV
jgi:hypothetical protein